MNENNEKQHEAQVEVESKRANDFDWIIPPEPENKKFGLALGNVRFAENVEKLQQQKIRAIISIFGEKDLVVESSIKHFRILISDNSRENIKCFFNASNQFIMENIIDKNVLVHCQAGVSRSATIVAAYLMRTKGLTHEQALSLIRQKRPHICPNKGFLKQLKSYEKELAQLNSSKCVIF